ncbi:hypothetical protein [Thermoactinomyces sp. DSM 45892]|uniref:hypothetical protein n=1 Tax=Thermoactinomyces sp. DSM 45892 TaxID=1882753 RepID=UPI00089801D9|nr:hypothetical protein [Thermoactinomyces sp. DSM 45892]SDZ35102.1 hypothetical protein SAMN05444416_12413 [Thermoactinomyces sp. DSM 45892]
MSRKSKFENRKFDFKKKLPFLSIVIGVGAVVLAIGYMLFLHNGAVGEFNKKITQVQNHNLKYGELSAKSSESFKKEKDMVLALKPAIEDNKDALNQIVKLIEEQQKTTELQKAELTKSKAIFPELKQQLNDLPSGYRASASELISQLEETTSLREQVYQQSELILKQEHALYLELSQGKLSTQKSMKEEYDKLNKLIGQLENQIKTELKAYQVYVDKTK